MKRWKPSISIIALTAANLVPLFGVLALGSNADKYTSELKSLKAARAKLK